VQKELIAIRDELNCINTVFLLKNNENNNGGHNYEYQRRSHEEALRMGREN
jgi:hypothetical protein